MRERERFSRSSQSHVVTLASLILSGCAGPPEPTMSAPQPILETRPDAGATASTPAPQDRHATHCSPDITTDLGAAMALGFSLAVIEPTETPTSIRWTVPGVNGEAVGVRFEARVVRSSTQSDTRLPETIEVHQWEAVVYAHVRDPMDPTDDTPGRAAPRRGRRMLALLNPDGMGATRGWRLARSWHLRSDDSIEGAALGLRADASTASVFDAYTARVAAMREAAAAPVMGGVR
jgi:hypothetical protein